MTGQQTFLLQRVQPAMVGLIDGSLSTLAPIFSVAIVTHKPHFAFIAGVAAAFGAGVSMAFSEGLSDTGELTGRGRPLVRGAVAIARLVGRSSTLDDAHWSSSSGGVTFSTASSPAGATYE